MQPNAQVGMRVTLFLTPDSANENKRIQALPSVIEELPDDGSILIQMPMRRGHFYPLPRKPIDMRFLHNSVPYSMPVLFEECLARDGFTLARMKRCGEIDKHQIRDSFRQDCSLPVEIRRSSKQNGTGGAAGIATNLSEGGMLLITNEELQMDEKIVVSFDIGSPETMVATVIRAEEAALGKYKYRAGLMFQYQDHSQADRIYKYVLDAQRKQRRKSRG